jgi:SNF2 family DNA or RNA helicase
MGSVSAAPFIPVPIFYKRFTTDEAATCPAAINTPAAQDATRRSTRTRTRPSPIVAQSSSTNAVKRKRDPTDVAECEESARHRKTKKDERDEQRAELSSARADLDLARKRWLYYNRALFEPLLPSHATSFFQNLIKEMAHDATPPLPMHEFVMQPELIVGGEMKQYQLEGLSFLAHMYHNGISCILGDEMGLGNCCAKTCNVLVLTTTQAKPSRRSRSSPTSKRPGRDLR